MATTVGASVITLGGLLRHLARVEQDSFSWKLHDGERPFCTSRWEGSDRSSRPCGTWPTPPTSGSTG
ncbi:MAG: hypothetical protein BGP03_06215 [Pseudonocardia sp. 73-21]|nr:MAG: hypothetical protein BGP03_06215 [Pseudonocardia sp. 73-21]